MPTYPILSIHDHPELIETAAAWFHSKWRAPKEAYLESMRDCVRGDSPVPQWYVMRDGETIIGGLGVIENDFHDRKDLTPNVCAVYVEPEYRNHGLAGRLLQRVCDDMARMGINTIYLLTDHIGFYERYGWEFLCMARSDGEETLSRMYVHRQ